jgi:hypothetical protein
MTSNNEIDLICNDVNTLAFFVEKISECLMKINKDLKTMECRHFDFVFDMECQLSNLRRALIAMEERFERTM